MGAGGQREAMTPLWLLSDGRVFLAVLQPKRRRRSALPAHSMATKENYLLRDV